MAYRRAKRYSTRSKVRRTYRKRRYNYRKKNFRGIRRGRIALNARPVTIKASSVPVILRMKATVDVAVNSVFWAYIQFQPCVAAAPLENINIIDCLNTDANTIPSYKIPTLSSGDDWNSVYAKTKLKKVVAHYIPGITQGLLTLTPDTSVSAAQAWVTCPIYDNVDDIIAADGKVKLPPTQAALQEIMRKPYCRTHSIYKPVTRVLSPKQFMSAPNYQGAASTFYKKNTFIDLSNQSVTLNGLLIGIPSLQGAGLTEGNPTSYPLLDTEFILGKVTLSYIQTFKVRT